METMHRNFDFRLGGRGRCYRRVLSFAYLFASLCTTGVVGDDGPTPASPTRVEDNKFEFTQDFHPVEDLCQRWHHQTVIANDSLYIDGGFWINNGQVDGGKKKIDEIVPLQNQYLIRLGLDTPFNASNPPYDPKSKPSMIPNTTDGYLFPDQSGSSFTLYGGSWSEWVTTSTKQAGEPKDFRVYTYDTLEKAWDRKPSPFDAGISGYANGAGAKLPEQNLGFYFGGKKDRTTDPSGGDPKAPIQDYSKSMLTWNLTDNKWDQEDIPKLLSTRTGAALVPVPDIGLQGILVLIGGNAVDGGLQVPAPLDKIFVYDVASKTWYGQDVDQQSPITVPSPRSDFCTAVGTATDGSSTQIFMYGGGLNNPTSSVLSDEMWILTIPTFQWVKVDIKNSSKMAPRRGHACEVFRGQMLVVGGETFGDPTDPKALGQSDVTCSASQFGIFDMGSLSWSDSFDPSHRSYEVPLPVSNLIGGSASGGSTKKKPANEFTDHGLEGVFANHPPPRPKVESDSAEAPSSSSSSTSSSSQSSARPTNVGMIVGATIAGMILLFIVIAVPLFFFWRRRKHRKEGKKSGKRGGKRSGGKYRSEKHQGAQSRGIPRGLESSTRSKGKKRSRGIAASEAGASNPDTWFSGDEKEDEDIMTPLNENWGYGTSTPPVARRAVTESSDSGTVKSMGDRQQRPRTVEITPGMQAGPYAQSAEIVNDYMSDPAAIYVEDSASQRGGDLNLGPAASVRDLMSVATMSSDALPRHYPHHHHHHHPSQQYQNQQFNFTQLNPHLQHVNMQASPVDPNSPGSDNVSPVSPQSTSGPSELAISPIIRSPRVKATDFYYSQQQKLQQQQQQQQRPSPSKRGSNAMSAKSDSSEATVVSPETRWTANSVSSNHTIPRKPVSNRNSTASPSPSLVS